MSFCLFTNFDAQFSFWRFFLCSVFCVLCYVIGVLCYVLDVVCFVLCVICYMLSVVCYVLCVICCVFCVMCYVLCVLFSCRHLCSWPESMPWRQSPKQIGDAFDRSYLHC